MFSEWNNTEKHILIQFGAKIANSISVEIQISTFKDKKGREGVWAHSSKSFFLSKPL